MSDENAIINALDAAAREWYKPDWEELAERLAKTCEKLENALRIASDLGILVDTDPSVDITGMVNAALRESESILPEFEIAKKAR